MIYCESTKSMVEIISLLHANEIRFEVENWANNFDKWIITTR